MIPDNMNFLILAEAQVHTLCSIKVYQLIIAHIFQVHMTNIVLKVSIMQHLLQEFLFHTFY